MKIDLIKIYKAGYSFLGLMTAICGLVHLCANDFGKVSINKLQSNASVICGLIALLLMVNGIYMIVSPWLAYVPKVKKIYNWWSLPVSLAWMLVTSAVTFFFVGILGLIVSIFLWLLTICGVVLLVLTCKSGAGNLNSSSSDDDQFNP